MFRRLRTPRQCLQLIIRWPVVVHAHSSSDCRDVVALHLGAFVRPERVPPRIDGRRRDTCVESRLTERTCSPGSQWAGQFAGTEVRSFIAKLTPGGMKQILSIDENEASAVHSGELPE